MRRGTLATLGSSPTMVGAVTVLIVVVAVFLAYNANRGLPFVPTYGLTAQLPNAGTLVPGNEVRMGGVRVGLVEAVSPVAGADGSVSARVEMKLDAEVEPLPDDSTVSVRARSALGLKYLEIVRGDSPQGYPQGADMPLSAATPTPVEIDEVLGMFDGPTRAAIQVNLTEFGSALAGRGASLNMTMGRLPQTLELLEPVMRNLGARPTRLRRFVGSLSALAAEVAPVAEVQARMMGSLDTTFGALASVARRDSAGCAGVPAACGIQDTISGSQPTLATATETLPRIRPFLAETASLFAELRPGAEALARTAPTIASALEVGAEVLPRAPRLNRELPPTARSLERLNDDAAARAGLSRLIEGTGELDPALRFIAPAETVCHYGSLLFSNLSSIFSAGNALGTWQRFIVFNPPSGPNNEGGPASAPASGGPGSSSNNYLHSNPYPNTASPGQPRECEAGRSPWIGGRAVIGNVPGNQGTP